jgi:hypothetical protein
MHLPRFCMKVIYFKNARVGLINKCLFLKFILCITGGRNFFIKIAYRTQTNTKLTG